MMTRKEFKLAYTPGPEPKKKLLYGVFVWHSDPRYSASEAIRVFKIESAADAYAREHELVVRPITP